MLVLLRPMILLLLVTLPPFIVKVPLPKYPVIKAPEIIQLPPEMEALLLLVGFNPMNVFLLVTLPPSIAKVPLPTMPMYRSV